MINYYTPPYTIGDYINLQIPEIPYIISELEQTVLYFSAQKQGGSKARRNKGKDWIKRGGSLRNKAKTILKRKKKRRTK